LETYRLTAKTLEGLEEVLSREILEIGGREVHSNLRAVHFTGDKAMIYRANYRLRTALRIFRLIESFRFKSLDDFYLQCLKINWEQFMNLNHSFAVHSTVTGSDIFRNSMYASLKLKDAIADRFRQKTGKRPDVDTSEPDILFHVHISDTLCDVSIDSSGESLHKRGYRQLQGDAPLNEVLAAGMILLSGWKGDCDFFDPMCGSGTLPIEAALLARGIPPGKFRKSYAFMNWKDFDQELFEAVRNESGIQEFHHMIFASDISEKSVLAAKTNARNARVFNLIDFRTADFREASPEFTNGMIMMNPPYGERIKGENLSQIYQMIGERLKHRFPGNVAWILSSSAEFLQHIGLKYSTRIKLYNGAIQCSFQKYELFEGKRKLMISKKKGI